VKARGLRGLLLASAREAAAAVAATAEAVAVAEVHPSSPVGNHWATCSNSCRHEAGPGALPSGGAFI
jgi:hypothetical protein